MERYEIEQALDQISEIHDQVMQLSAERQTALDSVIPAEVKQQMDAVDLEYAGKISAASQNSKELEDQVRAAVLELGESVRGKSIHAIWMKGRVSWDSAKLEGLMIAIPALKEVRKEGDPSVSLRGVK